MTRFSLSLTGQTDKILHLSCIILIYVLSGLTGLTAHATTQDDAALFEELENDQALSPPPLMGVTRKIQHQLVDNLDATLRLKYNYFFDEPDNRQQADVPEGMDTTHHEGEALLTFSTWIGSSDLKFHLAGWAEYGTQDDTYRGCSQWFQDDAHYRRIVEINELYAAFSLDAMDITVGKKEVGTGISTLFSPSDRFRPADLNDPLDPKPFGLWQIRADHYLDNSKIELILIPIYTYKKFPEPGSRWWGEYNNLAFGDDMPDISWEYIDLFAKYKTTLNGWDLFVSANSGPNPYIVVREQGGIPFQTVNRIFTLAAGFSTTQGKFEIHGESLFNYSHKERDDDYLVSVIGFTYTMDDKAKYLAMEQVKWTLEYAGEWILDKQSGDGYIRSSQNARIGVNDIFSRLTLTYNKDLTFNNHTHFRRSDQSWLNRFEARYRFFSGLSLSCALTIFEGEQSESPNGAYTIFEDLSYGQWDQNDRVSVMLTYDF